MGAPGLGHVLDRDDDLEVELLLVARVDNRALALWPDQELGNPLKRSLRRGKADPLHPQVGETSPTP